MVAEIADILGLAFIPLFLALDLVVRHKSFRPVRHWRLTGLVVTAIGFGLSLFVMTAWATALGDWALLDLSALGTWGGALVGILAYELVHYWYHRTAHRWTWLWRGAHQMHHSAESLDAFGAYYLHPLDVFFFTTWSTVVVVALGLAPAAGAVIGAFLVFNAMFQHANIRTPQWLGYLIQRPESHSVHHERGVHAHNYSDLPVWDILFGTFANPAEMVDEVGFYDGASTRIPEMLIGRDVSEPPHVHDARVTT